MSTYVANPGISRATHLLFGARALGRTTSESVALWATECLESGADTPSLRICAGLVSETNGFEADDYLRRALAELELAQPSPESALRSYVEQLAVEVIAGRIEPVSCVRDIYAAYVALGYPRELAEWLLLDDAIYDLERGAEVLLPYLQHDLTPSNYGAHVRAAAARLLDLK